MLQRTIVLIALTLPMIVAGPTWGAVRIKDITDLEGARNNHLYGMGLVIGLQGTGSRSLATQQVIVDMLQKLDVTARIFNQSPSDNVIRSTNASIVMVAAKIGPFNRIGSKLDVTVSSIDDASSLQGGVLVLTPLRGVDNQVYAVAEGPLSIGGFNIQGQAAGVQKNHPTVGRIPNGAIVEKEALGPVVCDGKSKLLLRDADFNTARLMAKVINQHFPGTAHALDAGAVGLIIPPELCANPVAFLSEVGLLEVEPDMPARVVINERTGTVVVGGNVRISSAAVAHANLTVVIAETPLVSQPEPFSRGGRTAVVPRTQVGVSEEGTKLNVLPSSSTVGELARALNALGVSPRDLITIFQQLKGAGALHAELELN